MSDLIVTGTLRERFTQTFIEHGTDWEDLGEDSPAGQLIDDLIEVTAGWLEDDDTRAVVYDGMVTTGPMLRNVGKSLARAARGEQVEGVEDDESEEAVIG
jgi:hypothetical protein